MSRLTVLRPNTDACSIVQTAWHSVSPQPLLLQIAMFLAFYPQLGTCAMKPREETGVVDARLNVYGVQNLKVVDVSVPESFPFSLNWTPPPPI